MAQPFEYQERLASLTRRQREIEDSLDLTKNEAGTQQEDQGGSDSVEKEAGVDSEEGEVKF